MDIFDLFCLLKINENDNNDNNNKLQDEIDSYIYGDNSILNELRKEENNSDF